MSASFMQVSSWDFVDFHLRALRVLRGNPIPPTTVENDYSRLAPATLSRSTPDLPAS